MKIAIIGAKRRDSMEFHFADALSIMNHNAKIFDIYESFCYNSLLLRPYCIAIDKFCRTYSDRYDKDRFDKLAVHVDEFGPELVLCFYREIHPSFVTRMKKQGRIVVHINPDQLTTMGYQQVLAADYDAWFVKDRYMWSFMKHNLKLNVHIYNEAFNHRFNSKPVMNKYMAESMFAVDVMTYGTMYPYRARMIKRLVDAGIDVKLYGVVPNRFADATIADRFTGQYLVGEEKAHAIYGSKIVFNNLHYAEIASVNCRFFEANGCGAFQLCDYRPILHELLPVDAEAVSFKTIDEAIEKINYYLLHDTERYEIASKIYNHFIDNYTYDHLVQYVLNIINQL